MLALLPLLLELRAIYSLIVVFWAARFGALTEQYSAILDFLLNDILLYFKYWVYNTFLISEPLGASSRKLYFLLSRGTWDMITFHEVFGRSNPIERGTFFSSQSVVWFLKGTVFDTLTVRCGVYVSSLWIWEVWTDNIWRQWCWMLPSLVHTKPYSFHLVVLTHSSKGSHTPCQNSNYP